eukprot:CAMPEP_0171496420 /NCGR_PEP_ID=MMETSP0958-20121227/6695_1 /TAXON_ID=87120 /ORGANISM="Aurantiochytrium limacinum, Strain ATCCMYA-1381" /LENGTH=71 /DNA_ID=CAMNT_0012030527 /DNA_START=79 /DNA_END=294 /DNA_ORIENTATION=+
MPTGTNSQGNSYNAPAVSQPGTNSYHYSNSNGSYYYSNSNGSTYYNSGSGYSQYTSPSGSTTQSYTSSGKK